MASLVIYCGILLRLELTSLTLLRDKTSLNHAFALSCICGFIPFCIFINLHNNVATGRAHFLLAGVSLSPDEKKWISHPLYPLLEEIVMMESLNQADDSLNPILDRMILVTDSCL